MRIRLQVDESACACLLKYSRMTQRRRSRGTRNIDGPTSARTVASVQRKVESVNDYIISLSLYNFSFSREVRWILSENWIAPNEFTFAYFKFISSAVMPLAVRRGGLCAFCTFRASLAHSANRPNPPNQQNGARHLSESGLQIPKTDADFVRFLIITTLNSSDSCLLAHDTTDAGRQKKQNRE